MGIRQKETFSIQLLQLLDAALVWLAFLAADSFRDPAREFFGMEIVEGGSLSTMTWVLYIAVPFTPLVLELLGFYSRVRSKSFPRALSQLLRGVLIILLLVATFSIFTRMPEAGRFVLALGGAFTTVVLLARDRCMRFFLSRRFSKNVQKERVVIAGSETETEGFLERLDAYERESFTVVGRFDLANDEITELYYLIKEKSVERVIFVAGATEFDKVGAGVEACEVQGVEAWVAASFLRTQIARPTFDSIGDHPMLVLRSTPDLSWELLLKGAIDKLGSILIILATSPLWIFAYVGIKISSPGAPVIFSQGRAGRYGQPFQMLKFRTMVANAEELLDKVKEEHGNEMSGPVFKLGHDPRIFKFGALLRKFSIDELPQLINVLRGEMSLVGPRPLPLYEVEAFERSAHRRRLSVKPGLTCEWQIGGRNRIDSFEEWVDMDLRYIDNWSLWLDFQILLRTVPAVLLARGAK